MFEAIVLALKGRDRIQHIDLADEHLMLLRMHVRLAVYVDLIGEEQSLNALRLLDSIGRQIGGWQKHLLEAS